MSKIIDNIIGLRRYFALILRHKTVPKAELLTTNEALKAFGTVGLHHEAEVLMMMAVIEYEFGRNYNYTQDQISAVKNTLVEVRKFFKECGNEWEQYEATQAKQAKE